MDKAGKRTNNTIIRGLIAAVFSLPVVMTSWTIYPSHVGKWLLVSGLIVVLVAYSILRNTNSKEGLLRANLSIILLTLYGLIITVWSFVGDPEQALFGDALRLTGAWMWIIMIAFAWWLAWWAQNDARRLYILRWQTFAASATAILTVLVQYAPDFFGVSFTNELFTESRLMGLWGSSTYLAGYLLTSLFFVWLHIRNETSKRIRWIAIATICALLYLLMQTGSRGASIGLILGITMMILVGIQTHSEQAKKYIKGITAAGLIIIVAGVYAAAFTSKEKASQTIYHPDYWYEQLGSQGGISTRLILWSTALSGVQSKPLIGWGYGMYERVFDTHYNPTLVEYGVQETWAERAHNQLLETAANMGIIGLLAYLLLIASPLISTSRSEDEKIYIIATAGITGAYFGFGLFAFDTPSLIFHLAVIMGLSASYGTKKTTPTKLSPTSIRVLTAVIAITSLYIFTIKPLEEAQAVAQVRTEFAQGAVEAYEHRLKSALKLESLVRTDTLKLLTDDLVNNNNGAVSADMYKVAIPLLLQAYQSYNEDFSPRYAMKLREAQLQALTVEYIDTEAAGLAHAAFDASRELSPGRQTTDISEIQLFLQLGDIVSAQQLIEKVVEEVPIREFKWLQVVLLSSEDKNKEAGKIAGDLIRKGLYLTNATQESLELVLLALESVEDYEGAFLQLRATLDLSGGDTVLNTGYNHLRMAFAAYNLGGLQVAQSEAVRALELDPTLEPQVTDLIKRIKERL